MFLSEQVTSWIQHLNVTHAPHLALAKRTNEVAHRALFAAKVVRTDLQHVLLVALVQRAMTAYQAAIILWEHGLPQEGQVALRTLLEVEFKAVAIAKDPEIAIKYAREDETLRRRLINKPKLLSTEVQDPDALAQLDSLQRSVNESIRSADIKELKTEWFAQKAGLLDVHNSAYAVLSTEAHVSSRTLERSLNLDQAGQIVGMKYGFSDFGLVHNLLTCIDAFLATLKAGYSKGDIPDESVQEIEAAYDELKRLQRRESVA